MPVAFTLKGLGIVKTTSGLGMRQPSAKVGAAGISLGSPSGVPARTQSAIVFFSSAVRRLSLAKWPYLGSACHGGMRPARTTSSMVSAQPIASSYDVSENGPICPGRWHSTQCLLKMRATSLAKVTVPVAAGLWTRPMKQPTVGVVGLLIGLPASNSSSAALRSFCVVFVREMPTLY